MTTLQIAVYDPAGNKIWESDQLEPDADGNVKVPLQGIPEGRMFVATWPAATMREVRHFATPPLPEGAQYGILSTSPPTTASAIPNFPPRLRDRISEAIDEYRDKNDLPTWFWEPDNVKELSRAIALFIDDPTRRRQIDWRAV